MLITKIEQNSRNRTVEKTFDSRKILKSIELTDYININNIQIKSWIEINTKSFLFRIILYFVHNFTMQPT